MQPAIDWQVYRSENRVNLVKSSCPVSMIIRESKSKTIEQNRIVAGGTQVLRTTVRYGGIGWRVDEEDGGDGFLGPTMVAQIEELAEKYLELLGYVETGTFVEVGASGERSFNKFVIARVTCREDGRRWSNSYSLARMGWYGHYIEAVKMKHQE